MKKKSQTISVNLSSQIQEDYLAYSMSVLVGRSIPDLYDGLKPAQRRVLQTMIEEGLTPDKKFVKCARVTGLTMAYFHPHGSVYGPLVNMATPWNNNVTWINGHGNFGSTVDGPAAERYTECKLEAAAVDLLLQDGEVWETKPNYDGSKKEAIRFNAAIPTVLLNGDSGIAVGFATKLAPHNLASIVKALENPKIASEELIPDFPTGCDIVADDQLQQYKKTGQGNIRCRAKLSTGIQKRGGRAKDRPTLTFTNLPPGVNPEKIGTQIKECLDKGVLDGITEVIDESDLRGDRITVVGKVDTGLDRLSQQLYNYTDLDARYAARTLVIDGVKPVELNPSEVAAKWARWRVGVLERKFRAALNETERRLEIVSGFLKAIGQIDKVIATIRKSSSKSEALIALVDRPFKYTRDQADAILEMRLRQLTNLDATKLDQEKSDLEKDLQIFENLVSSEKARTQFMIKEAKAAARKYGRERQSSLIQVEEPAIERKVRTVSTSAKPRFLKVDEKRGVVEVVKGPRGALICEKTDKLVLMTEDGTWRKVPSTFKGAISNQFSPVMLAKREAEVKERKYLVLFEFEDQIKALVIVGEELCKATSKSKRWLPEGAKALYFGEQPRIVLWNSARKKPTKVELNVKQGKPGGRGIKIGSSTDFKAVTGLYDKPS